jgi:hypothetical protein
MKKNSEIWKDIVGFEGIFQVSSTGRVYSYKRNGTLGGILKGQYTNLGYHRYLLSKNGIKRSFFAHRLVADAFIPNPKHLPLINHKDEISSHNWVDNLEWCTAKYNTNYGNGIKRRSESRYKKVYQFNKVGNLIKTWNSGTEIQQKMGFLQSKTGEVANGKRKSAYGFLWSYNKIPGIL